MRGTLKWEGVLCSTGPHFRGWPRDLHHIQDPDCFQALVGKGIGHKPALYIRDETLPEEQGPRIQNPGISGRWLAPRIALRN